MSAFYADESNTWKPFAGEGGGSVEKLQLDTSRGGTAGAAIVKSVDDRVWDHFEPYVGGTNISYAFYSMSNITRVPWFDTSNTTFMNSTFQGCSSLVEVPQFVTSNVTNMGNMFQGCSSLVEIPTFNTSNVANMSSMFNGCRSLAEIPELDMSNVTSLTLFAGSSSSSTQLKSLTSFKAFGATRGFMLRGTKMDAAALNELMSNLGTASGAQTLDIRSNPGSSTCDTSIATAKGWTVTV